MWLWLVSNINDLRVCEFQLFWIFFGNECVETIQAVALCSLWNFHCQQTFPWSLSMLQLPHNTFGSIRLDTEDNIQCLISSFNSVVRMKLKVIAAFTTWWNREFNYDIVQFIRKFRKFLVDKNRMGKNETNRFFLVLSFKRVIMLGHFHSFISLFFCLVNCGSLSHFTSSFAIWIE